MKNLLLISLLMFLGIPTFSQTTVILQPGPADGKDAKTKKIDPNHNLGYSTDITAHAFDLGSDTNYSRSYIEFDLSGIPSNCIIHEAKLSLYIAPNLPNNPPGQTGDNEWCIRRVIAPWGENTITWNNQPPSSEMGEVVLPKSTHSQQSYPDIEITNIIDFLVHHPDSNFGIMFKLYEEIAHKTLCFCSSDYMVDSLLRPKLEITYSTGPIPSAMYSSYRLGDSLIFINESVDADTYYWDFGDGFSSTLENPIHHYTSYNKYNVCLTAYNNHGESTYCDSINVCPLAKAYFQYLIQGDTVLFMNLSSNALTYYWDFGDGYGTSVENPFHYYGSPGSYDVCLTVTNECSVDTICELIDLTHIIETINGIDAISVYPNPASDFIYLKNNGSIDKELLIEVYGLSGKKLFHERTNLGKNAIFNIDIANYSSGTYVIRLSDGKKSANRLIQIK